MTPLIGIAVGVFGSLLLLFLLTLKSCVFVCPPNQVLILSGKKRRMAGRQVGYRVIKGGFGYRVPLLERVDRLDLTNMIIDLRASNAYCKNGVPLEVQGIANVKIASHEPLLNHAIERFNGKSRQQVMAIARATLEGSLRGVIATLTPEQINEDRNLFAEKVAQEVEQDVDALGLTVDTLKIQNITDEVNYLDSIGRIRNSEIQSKSRIAEAIARADSMVVSANNSVQEAEAEINAAIEVAKADAEKRLMDTRTRRDALVAEEKAAVAALVAQAKSDLPVQRARIEQIRRQLQADVIEPARAQCEAREEQARADVAPIIEEGRARAAALESLSESWQMAGPKAREIFLLQKLEPVIDEITATISDARVDRISIIDRKSTGGSGGTVDATRLYALSEQVKEVFGIDLVAKLQEVTEPRVNPQVNRAVEDHDEGPASLEPPPQIRD